MVNLLCRAYKFTLTLRQEDVLKIILVLLFQLISQGQLYSEIYSNGLFMFCMSFVAHN